MGDVTALFGWLLTNPTILAILAGIVGALGWGFKQRLAGTKAERDKQARADQRVRDIADEIQNDIRAMSPEQVEAELRKRAPKK